MANLLSIPSIAWVLGIVFQPTLADAPGTQPESAAPPLWLEEVKAQRRAWEEQVRQAREAADARHRMIDPWGAAQLDAREHSAEIRREAARNQSELRRKSMDAEFEARHQELENLRQQRALERQLTRPFGWDNPWYFRGY